MFMYMSVRSCECFESVTVSIYVPSINYISELKVAQFNQLFCNSLSNLNQNILAEENPKTV